MNEIKLNYLKLKTFSEQEALDYCQLNNINPDDITVLDLSYNELTDISGIKLFKNLKQLDLYDNKTTDISCLKNLINLEKLFLYKNNIKNISVLKNLKNLEDLNIGYNLIKDISVLKDLKNLKFLSLSKNSITDISVIKNFIQLEVLNINDLKLRSNQILYINFCKNLKELWSINGFKKINILNQLINKNIKLHKSL